MVYGYATEKVVHALAAGTVLIYKGAPDVNIDFNPEAFINVDDFKTIDDLIARIKEVDEDPELYRKMVTTPIF